MTAPGGVVVRARALTTDGLVVVPDSSGNVALHTSTVISLQGSGYKPRSLVTILLAPGNLEVGKGTSDKQGNISSDVKVPKNSTPGDYAVTMQGWNSAGELLEISMAISVVSDATALDVMRPAVGLSTASISWVSVAVGVAALSMYYMFFARRRVEDEEDFVDFFRVGK